MQQAGGKIRTVQDGHIASITRALKNKVALLDNVMNGGPGATSPEEIVFALVAAREGMATALRFIQTSVCPHHGTTWHEDNAQIDKCVICNGRLGHEQEQG